MRDLHPADRAQSSRVPVPLPEDPYEAIRQAYLVGTDTESEPIEDLVETEAPESPHTIASPTSLPNGTPLTCHVEESEGSNTSGARFTSSDSTAPLSPDHPLTHTTPTLVPILCRTAHMVMRIPSAMSPGLSASVAEVTAMSDSMFLEDDEEEAEDDKEGDDEEENEEMEESSDSNNVSKDTEDEGPTVEDKDLAVKDEGFATGDEGPGMGVKSLSLGGDEVVPGGQSSRSVPESERPEIVSALRHPTHTKWMDPEDGIVYIDVLVYPSPPLHAQTPPSPEWPSGSLPISPAPSIGGLIHDHMVRLEELSPALFERSLEHEQERVAVTFGAIWRPLLALESWEGQTDAQIAAL
ncbi:hypothetical protein Tco_1556863 [Tanacetum coccineum]